MSKRFKGKTCAYCASLGASETGDHVFARQFFPVEKRQNLPQVPACVSCNNKKAELEHYLTTVLPFAGRHADAPRMLTEMVPDRLAKNLKLHRELSEGKTQTWEEVGGLLVPRMALPFQSEKLASLCEYIAKGLAVHHWGTVIPADHNVRAGMVTAYGDQQFKRFLAMNGNRVSESWGDDAFRYEGLQSREHLGLTVWRFEPYGAIQMSGDSNAPEEAPTCVWVTTSRSGTFGALLDGEELPAPIAL